MDCTDFRVLGPRSSSAADKGIVALGKCREVCMGGCRSPTLVAGSTRDIRGRGSLAMNAWWQVKCLDYEPGKGCWEAERRRMDTT